MKLVFSVALLAAVATLCSSQHSSFQYNQQFGAFDDNRTFRLKQGHPQQPAAAPIQDIIFPGPTDAVVVAPIPVIRAINNPPSPGVATAADIIRDEPAISVSPPQRHVVKKVRVIKEKAKAETPRNVNVFSNPENGLSVAEEDRLLREEEAKNAHYSFSSSVQDSINDHAIVRQETRDGLALTGMYSYSDGFFKRTVHYQADQDGYRVVKEEIEPIGQGPVFNPKGTADVESSLSGRYSITADDINLPKQTTVRKTTT